MICSESVSDDRPRQADLRLTHESEKRAVDGDVPESTSSLNSRDADVHELSRIS